MSEHPSVIGPYRILRKLGGGGMGVVYEGLNEALERRVAIKLLHAQHEKDAEYSRRLFNEARAANRIGHPGLVQISEFGQLDNGSPYLVMEFLSGRTLRETLNAGPLAVSDILDITQQIVAVLRAAHEKGIVHRDLKPENIMLVSDEALPKGRRVKVLDFGIAKRLATTPELVTLTKTPDHRIMGTPAYMAPEQCLGAAGVDAKADVYSLGIIVYEMLAGEVPFAGVGTSDVAMLSAHLTSEVPPLSRRVPECPAQLAELVQRLLHKKRDQRPASDDVQTDLNRLAQDPKIASLGVLRRSAGSMTGPVNPFAATMAEAGAAAQPEAAPVNPFARTLHAEATPGKRNLALRLGLLVALGVVLLGVSVIVLSPSAANAPLPAATAPRPASAHDAVAGATPASSGSQAATPQAEPIAQPAPSVRDSGRVRFSVTSNPPGAEVVRLSDSVVLGKTPLQVEQRADDAGTKLLLRLPGHRPGELALTGSASTVQHLDLEALPASPPPAAKRRRVTPSSAAKEAEGKRTPLFE